MNAILPFQAWSHRAVTGERAEIFPDGCRDILIVRSPGQPTRISLSPFDLCPRHVVLPVGTEISGYRLRPGAAVDDRILAAIAGAPDKVREILGSEFSGQGETDEMVFALIRPDTSVRQTAADLGVSVRTLERRFRSRRLPPPDYWRLLARARRAAWLLSSGRPLAEIAAGCGFADQAHMTRDLVRWFGRTPALLQREPGALDLASQPALGNWTGEQISTR